MADEAGGMVQRLQAARAGSLEALGEALEACRAYLLAIANRQLAPDLKVKGGASDLVQETFLEAQRDFPRFDGTTDEELRAWLGRLLLNNLASFARSYRATGKRLIDREISLETVAFAHGPGDLLAADIPSPSFHAISLEQAELIQQALKKLPEDYARVIVLRNQEDRSFAEIAEQMQRSENAVRKLWFRAIERLQQEMGEAS
jgi:RNA polymerase sigma-70 factor (ECF subfamily)